MIKMRFVSLVVLLATVMALAGLSSAAPAQAAGEQWLLQGRLASGCNSGDTGFSVSFVNLTPGATYYADTIVKNGAGVVYMDEYFGSTAPGPFDTDWFVFDENTRGMQTGSWPLTPGTQYTITVRLLDAGQNQLSVNSAHFTCDANDFNGISTTAGCDVLMNIPASAVGGTFIADAPLYSEPGVLVEPPLTMTAGKSARVIGMDSTGQYYKILWVCQFLWVPANTLGPNYDDVWHGAALPTSNVVN